MSHLISGYSSASTNKIDQLVYQLYELTDDEIKVVEGE